MRGRSSCHVRVGRVFLYVARDLQEVPHGAHERRASERARGIGEARRRNAGGKCHDTQREETAPGGKFATCGGRPMCRDIHPCHVPRRPPPPREDTPRLASSSPLAPTTFAVVGAFVFPYRHAT